VPRLYASGADGYSEEPDVCLSEACVVVSDKGVMFIGEETGGARLTAGGIDLGGYARVSECAFRAHVIKDDHAILFYQTPAGAEASHGFGYRELNFSRAADFRPVHMGAGVTRYSALTTTDSIHFLYIVQTILGARLLYRRKHRAGLSAAVTVCEGGRMDGCWLFIIKNRLYAAYTSARALYLCVSDDDGQGFRRPFRYRSKLCESPVKAAYMTQLPQDESELAVREVFVDSLNPWDVQVLPELYADFFPVNAPAVTQDAEPAPVKAPEGISKEDRNEGDGWYGADMPEAGKLHNRMEGLERQLTDRNKQITALKREIETQRSVIERLYQAQEERQKEAH
jgi:hypothetical protein